MFSRKILDKTSTISMLFEKLSRACFIQIALETIIYITHTKIALI
jgi:hypothetical protein